MQLLGSCSKDGLYGLFAPPRGGLDLLDLKHGTVVSTLIPRVSEGINDVKCQFNATNEYVLYYHSGRKTLRVFRVIDGELIADYRVPSNLTSLESTTDGKSIALGLVDGNLLILTIADPDKKKMIRYLRNLPSRAGMQGAYADKGVTQISKTLKNIQNADKFVDGLEEALDKHRKESERKRRQQSELENAEEN